VDDSTEKILTLIKEPYSVENTLEAFKAVHDILGFDYTNSVDFSRYDESINEYIQNPIHLVVDICMSQLSGLILAVLETVKLGAGKPNYKTDMGKVLDEIIDFAMITLISYYNDPKPIQLPGTLSDKANRALNNADKNFCLMFKNEVNIILTTFMAVLRLMYSEEVAKYFKSLTNQWTEGIFEVFVTTMMIKGAQNGGR